MKSRFVKETFNLPLLPYVCQRRFAEICDSQTLKTFSLINLGARNLCKRCHIIENVNIDLLNESTTTCKYKVLCFCKENEFCKGIDNIFQLVKKADIRNTVTIQKNSNGKLDRKLLQKLPICILSTSELILSFEHIHLNDLKVLTTINYKLLHFMGDIEYNSIQQFIKYIKDLSKNRGGFKFLVESNLRLNRSKFTELVNELIILKSQGIIYTVRHENPFIRFSKAYSKV